MSASVTVQRSARYGWAVCCSQCGIVARREFEMDAQCKAQRHEEEHQRGRGVA